MYYDGSSEGMGQSATMGVKTCSRPGTTVDFI